MALILHAYRIIRRKNIRNLLPPPILLTPSAAPMRNRFKMLSNSVRNLSIALSCALPMLAAVAGGTSEAGKSAADPAKLYQSYCSVCHGDKGDGQSRARASLNPTPVDFTSPGTRAMLTRERMILGVREGRPGTAMVGWKTQLSDVQIAAIVDHVRNTFMNANANLDAGSAQIGAAKPFVAPAASQYKNTAPVPASLKGDWAAGQRLYEQNCVACHGRDGDGNGPRAYFISPRPRSFVSAESRAAFGRPLLILSIAQGKRGTEMPSWEKVLNAQDIANTAEYVYQRFITTAASPIQNDRK